MKILVIDTETTGLDRASDEPVSIAMVDGEGNAILDTLVKPLMKESWPQAQRIHGISPQDVEGAPYMATLFPIIEKAIEEADLVIGYNLQFDLGMLHQFVPPEKQFDVMLEFAKVHGQIRGDGTRKWSNLAECAAHYGYEFQPHGALEDCRATLHCYRALVENGEYRARLKAAEEGAKRAKADAAACWAKTAAGIALGFGGIVVFLASFAHMLDGTIGAWVMAGFAMVLAGYMVLTKL